MDSYSFIERNGDHFFLTSEEEEGCRSRLREVSQSKDWLDLVKIREDIEFDNIVLIEEGIFY